MGRVLAALSGGVDSAVAAALLVGEGHEVIGVSLQLSVESGEEGRSRCCSPSDLRDARCVAGRLGIPHYVLNEEEAFSRHVLGPFLEGYRAGRTPNPCVRCNSVLKFGALIEIARAVGAEKVATGHYARVETDRATGRRRLLRGADRDKDQSYFLFDLDQEQLAAALFPLGGRTKSEVRGLAGALGLPVAGKPESQDLCFVPGGDVGSWIRRRIGDGGGGEIVDEGGRVLGRHAGVHAFTVGQRRGLGVSRRRPLYVVSIDAAGGRVVVGDEHALLRSELTASARRLHDPALAEGPFRAEAKVRSRHEAASAEVTPLPEGRLRVRFEEPQRAIAPGQALVLYRGDEVVGGGWIEPDARALDSGPAPPLPFEPSRTERA